MSVIATKPHKVEGSEGAVSVVVRYNFRATTWQYCMARFTQRSNSSSGYSVAGDLGLVDLCTLTKRFYSSSVSEDLGCRRGEFSRKHYGSVELLISSDADGAIQRAGRFRVENGSSGENTDYTPGTWHRTDVHLENPEYHTRWYFKYFLGKVHQNYIGTDAEKNPFFLSVVLSDQNNQRVPQYHSILWRKTGTQKICLPYSPTKTLSVKSILSAMSLDKFEKSPREIFHPQIQKDLLVLEEQEGSVNFKFGVLYAKDGQLTDDEMFSNDDTTGTCSIYTVFQGHEIMFHVSTMLPYSRENKQQ
ncbi:PREDICTED: GTPase-activating Rap/Ran-GAP domain-like protein 3, partial [Fulmarus glacialis]|uniref:GTPase-activating Rap/Ran-GAP domain-like protein 3 n=1 Tax=Fulmarus glacialis TaxID=30455 RepID=UPI00051BFC4B